MEEKKIIFTSAAILFKTIDPLLGIIPTKPIIPILNCFLLEFKKNKITIYASDLQTLLATEVDIENEEEFKIAVPAKIFSETIKNLGEETVSIIINEEKLLLKIKSQNGEYNISCENPDAFPLFKLDKEVKIFSFNAKELKEGLQKTISVVNQDSINPVINGVLFNINEKGEMVLVGTDVHRLIKIKISNVVSFEKTSFILPKKTVQMLIPLLTTEEKIEIKIDGKRFFSEIKNISLFSNIIEGKYPDYENAFPKNNNIVLKVNKSVLLFALKRLLIFTNSFSYKIKFIIKKNKITIIGEDTNFENKAEENIECDFVGEDFSVLYNIKYIMEMLQNMISEKVVFYLSEPNENGLSIKATLLMQEDSNLFEGLLMPMIEDPKNEFVA